MTPLDALHAMSCTFADVRQRHLLKEQPWVLSLCLTCEQALLRELDGMFALTQALHPRTLATSQVMGFTFDQGPPETCALHAYLQEDAACPLK